MTMTEKYKILGKFIKDMSSETKDAETYLFVKDRIAKYQLGIDINTKALKNKLVEVNTILKFEDKEKSKKKSYFEVTFFSCFSSFLVVFFLSTLFASTSLSTNSIIAIGALSP